MKQNLFTKAQHLDLIFNLPRGWDDAQLMQCNMQTQTVTMLIHNENSNGGYEIDFSITRSTRHLRTFFISNSLGVLSNYTSIQINCSIDEATLRT